MRRQSSSKDAIHRRETDPRYLPSQQVQEPTTHPYDTNQPDFRRQLGEAPAPVRKMPPVRYRSPPGPRYAAHTCFGDQRYKQLNQLSSPCDEAAIIHVFTVEAEGDRLSKVYTQVCANTDTMTHKPGDSHEWLRHGTRKRPSRPKGRRTDKQANGPRTETTKTEHHLAGPREQRKRDFNAPALSIKACRTRRTAGGAVR